MVAVSAASSVTSPPTTSTPAEAYMDATSAMDFSPPIPDLSRVTTTTEWPRAANSFTVALPM